MVEIMEERVRAGGELLKDVKFADDQGIVSLLESGLKQ